MDGSPYQGVNVLAREGEYWTVVFGGRVLPGPRRQGPPLPRPSRSATPAEEFHALALIAAIDPDPPRRRGRRASAGRPDHRPSGRRRAGARRQGGRRLPPAFLDLQEELAEAEACADEGRATRAQDEIDALTEQLAGGLGLGGRHRRAGSASERARLAVTKAIRSAMRRLDEADPDLGQHLERTMRTGTFCAYAPDPALGIVWLDSRSTPCRRRRRSPPRVGGARHGALRGPASGARADR